MGKIDHKFVSGIGQLHTNEYDPNNPNKKLTPYLEIDLEGIRALVDNPQSVDKAVAQWLIPSTLRSRTFKAQEKKGSYHLLWADLDDNPKPLSGLNEFIAELVHNDNYEIYATSSASVENQKARILIPLDSTLQFDDWTNCQSILNEKLNTAGFKPDEANVRSAQICYLPNRGEFYESYYQREGETFNPLNEWAGEIEARRHIQRDKAKELETLTKAAKTRRETLSSNDLVDTIGAFNNAYSVQEILKMAGYDQRGDNFRHPHSESGSFSAGVKDERVHSLSTADPLYSDGQGAHDAFSAFKALFADNNHSQALKLAGDQWLTIGGESYNKVKQREFKKNQKKLEVAADITRAAELKIHPLAMYLDLNINEHTPQEFILDNKIQAGVVLIAGGWGCGKTSNLVPLLSKAAHLCKDDDELRPTLKRKIIYITEDVSQIERILHSMWLSKEFGSATKDDIKDMFKIVEAKRMKPFEIVEVAGEYLKQVIVNVNPITNVQHEAKPLVVIDTINAVINLENESDNAEVGHVVASFKQEFKGIPVLLVAHLAKALLRSDVQNITARGGGAWEADAHQVLYLTKEENGNRWLDIGFPKHRFHADVDGIMFQGVVNETETKDIMGNLVKMKLIHGKPTMLPVGGRNAAKQFEKEQQGMIEMQKLSERIYKNIKELLNKTRYSYLTKNEIFDFMDKPKTRIAVFNMLDELVNLRVIAEVTNPENKRHHTHVTGLKLPEIELLSWDISKNTDTSIF